MIAAVLRAINKPLQIEEVDTPSTLEEEVLVDIHFGGLNHRDVWISKGMYAGIELPCILGSDGAGILNGAPVLINPSLNWGSNPAVQQNDYKILGLPDWGTFADQVKINKDRIYSVPKHLSLSEAAALPLAGLTAYRALVTKCNPQPGEKVLISGVGGGVALFAMQFAIALGCEVYVTSGSLDKIDKAVAMGAKGGVSYKEAGFEKDLKAMSGGMDIVIDSAAGDGFASLVKICNPAARLCFYGGTKGAINGLSPQLVFWKQLSIFGSTMGTDQEFEDMLTLVSKHEIYPCVDSVFELEQINEAFALMEVGAQFGKILINLKSR